MISEYNYLYHLSINSKKQNEEKYKILCQNHISDLIKQVPDKLNEFMNSRKMYQVLYGGRSSAKTYSSLLKLIIRALEKENQTILCTREYQSSIANSTYAELKQIINNKKLEQFFNVKHDHISCYNGTKFIFKGLARDIMQIKSIPNISVCFVEEAETITQDLWDVLDPTLRSEGCELIVIFNPKEKESSTYRIWVEEKIPEEDILRIEINYYDNPFNSKLILKKIERMKETDYARYEHIYLGKVLDISEDVIFKGRFKILDLNLEFDGVRYKKDGRNLPMLYGMDFGFSVDHAAMVELCFIDEETIYINQEIYLQNLLPSEYIKKIENSFGRYALSGRWFADCARPDTIAQLSQSGLRITGAPKPKGSIESGIEFLKSKNIIINPRCQNMIFEAYNYKYKIDKNSSEVTVDIIDKHNHLWDAIRYALCRQISASISKGFKFNEDMLKRLGVT